RASSTASTTQAGSRTHLVKRGETLSGLARRYGVSVQALQKANGLSSARDLKAGQKIKIPA
ncbi:MAG: LysM peptidoglycan-binding domain-containing protein, partial [Gemmatimonadota bacterium]|nr:LysM peptidoglycan-binding domain-containing protein [Gemmatimonadota bacterium]